MPSRLEPKIIQIFRDGYSTKQFSADLLAGIIVGIVALPLAIAFAIASGVKPEQGIYTAIVAGFSIALLGGSRVQVSGPTGAFIVVIYGIVQKYGYDGLVVATMIAGVMLVLMGFFRMGILLKFIPYPLTVGFTSGIALIIFSSQIRDLLGLTIPNVPADFIQKWATYNQYLSTLNPYALAIGIASMLIVLIWPKITRKIPGSIVAIVVMTVLVQLLKLPVETIGSRFGEVPNTLPYPTLPVLTWELIQKMFSPALTIAMLGAIESLLSAVVADGMIGTRHRSNMELVAQGIGNILSPLFGGIPATGAIARTATNVKNGGRTPISAIVHAITLLIIMVFFGKLAALIPMATLAAILIVVAYHMSEWHTFRQMLKAPKEDVVVLLTTFLLTVFIDLTVAIEVGVVLSAFLFLRRMETSTQVGAMRDAIDSDEDEAEEDIQTRVRREIPPGVEVFEVYGPLFFGAVDRFKAAMGRVESTPKVFILRMRHVPIIDATGLRAVEDLLVKVLKDAGQLILSGVRPEIRNTLEKSGLAAKIGAENIVPNLDEALNRAGVYVTQADK